MTTRVLPFSEWNRLKDTDFPIVLPHVSEADLEVFVVEDEHGQIVGAWGEMRRLEGLWIHPDHRKKAAVGRRLFYGMREHLRAKGVNWITTGAMDDTVRELLHAINAVPIPGDSYFLPIGSEVTSCR